jgi:hypothetical protein
MITLYVLSLVAFFFSFRFFRKNDWDCEVNEKSILAFIGLVACGVVSIGKTIELIIKFLP